MDRVSIVRRLGRSDKEVTMAINLKPLNEQVIVITGASSGIGLATAAAAAEAGAKLVLAARSSDTLADIVARLSASGAEVVHVTADVAEPDAVQQIAQAALTRFGGIDTWVNDAAVSIYGRLDEVSEEDSAPTIRRQLLGRRPRLVDRARVPAQPRRRHHQRRQRGVGCDRAAAGLLLGVEARGEGLHGRAARRGRGSRQGAGRHHADPAHGRRHAVPAARARTTWTGSRSCRHR